MNLREADDTMLIYSYCCYNVNNDNWQEMQRTEDGEIYIDRESLIEPEIHQKLKRMPDGRKKIVEKRIPREFSLAALLESEQITIKNASGTWRNTQEGIDMMACKMLFKMFNEYQETGVIPEHVSIFS